MSKCSHGLTSAECYVCASPKYGETLRFKGHRLPPDDTALLRQALGALESVYPYTDSLICYASTVDEHPPNAIDGNVRDALTALRERLKDQP